MSVKYFYNFKARQYPDYSKTVFDSMIVSDGYIINTGFQISNPFEDAESIDLNGCVILPPFVDSHVHFLQTGIVNCGCQLTEAYSLADIFDAVSLELKRNKIVLGWNLDLSNIKEKRLPTLKELDSISNKNFIWLASKDLHFAVANSEAIKWAKQKIKNFYHDDGLVSGETYNALCYKINDLLTESYKIKCLKKAEELCFLNGVATVHAMEGTEDNSYETELVYDYLKNSKLNAIVYNQSSNPSFAIKNKLRQMGGCILVDGSIGSRTAALFENYNDANTRGGLFLESENILKILRNANSNNLQLALHTIGDQACEVVASCYRIANETFGFNPDIRNRVEHFIMPNNKAIRNIRKSNSIVSIQPAYDYYWGGKNGLYSERLGEARSLECNPYKTLSDSGITMIGGSDSPVTPINPILGIHSLVNHRNPDERISLNQALSIFIDEPYKLFNDENTGKIELGKRADFICLDKDPFLVKRNEICNLKVKGLYVNGTFINV